MQFILDISFREFQKVSFLNSLTRESAQDVTEKSFKTAEESVEYLFLEELESEIIVLPPEVDELTDEEDFDDTETL
ncbi:hypothetical protein NPIL_485621 [Nephila pilipes]|uniref:Uncharacterized protein n=1 Tax=Nephila pilipes TaxID=299642 RepID=A0A8X6Q5A4_NEPPI|nr:hypothetical protein NPIL_485621 [Nephila pilipes]